MAIDNLTATTELEAVNALLRAIGEAPIAALGSGQPDEDMATAVLKEVTREVQTRRWRFNTEYNYEIASAGTEGGRNVFEVPSGLAGWDLAQTEAQRGLDIVAREERAAVPSDGAWIFADRLNGTDGIAGLSTLTIHPIWFTDFEKCPQSVRSYVVVAAGRRFQEQMVGRNQESSFGFSQEDEQRSLQLMMEDQEESFPVPALESVALTELEAVNQILMAGGKAPLMDLTAVFSSDQFRAIQVLRDASREVQMQGWRFNTELDFELAPTDTYSWVASDGSTVPLNIFEPPASPELLAFRVSPVQNQSDFDLVVRDSVRYTPGTRVFYDRVRNRDGLPQDSNEYLYLDVTWKIDWADLPESARQYIAILATLRFLQGLPEPPRTLPWSDREVREARRLLLQDQGDDRRLNIFDHADVWEGRGRRPGRSYYFARPITRR